MTLSMAILVLGIASLVVIKAQQASSVLVHRDKITDNGRIKESLDEANKRSEYYEGIVVTVGSIELAILAYMAGIILSKGVSVEHRRVFFWIATVLLSATTAAYLHAWRIYMAYGINIVNLEWLYYTDAPLRTVTRTLALAAEPNLGDSASVLTSFTKLARVTYTMLLSSSYPVVLLGAGVIGFGSRCRINPKIIVVLLSVLVSLSVIYAWPDVIEFFRVAEMARN
jgi:hypothetical protein